MVKRTLVALVAVATTVACGGHVPVPKPPTVSGAELTFFVRAAGRLPLQELSGVRVAGITAEGARVEFGHTWAGNLTIRKDLLRAANVQLLLFCLEGFHCSAYDLSSEKDDRTAPLLFDFDEWNVDLAPFVLYD
jgi:hypothetical protein